MFHNFVAENIVVYGVNSFIQRNMKNTGILEAIGYTVKELRNRNAENLAAKILEINEEKHLVRRVPVLKEVVKMINQAKELPPVMTY